MSTIGVAAASYEGSLFSWKGNCTQSDEVTSCELGMTSGFHCCAGSIRSLSTSATGRYMACGGTDERIHIFNMLENSTLGELSTHTGAVTCLDFFEDSHLLSGSDDNSICIWRTHDWMCVHILGGHKGSINSVSIHPSGKLAVSVAQDNTLTVWNLVQGRIAFTRRLKSSANLVKWLKPTGDAYMLVIGFKIEVYATADNSSLAVLQHESRVNQADFVGTEGNIVSVSEDKALRVFNSQGEMMSLLDFSSLDTRIRDFSLVAPCLSEEEESQLQAVALATSNGKILVVSLDALVVSAPVPDDEDFPSTPLSAALLGSFDIKAEPRLTCVSAWVQGEKKVAKKKVRRSKSKKANNVDSEENENSGTEAAGIKENKRKGGEQAVNDSAEDSSSKKVRFSESTDESKKKGSAKQSKKKTNKKGKK